MLLLNCYNIYATLWHRALVSFFGVILQRQVALRSLSWDRLVSQFFFVDEFILKRAGIEHPVQRYSVPIRSRNGLDRNTSGLYPRSKRRERLVRPFTCRESVLEVLTRTFSTCNPHTKRLKLANTVRLFCRSKVCFGLYAISFVTVANYRTGKSLQSLCRNNRIVAVCLAFFRRQVIPSSSQRTCTVWVASSSLGSLRS